MGYWREVKAILQKEAMGFMVHDASIDPRQGKLEATYHA